MVQDHFDEQVVEYSYISNVLSFGVLWANDIGSDCDRQIICRHLVLGLARRNFGKELHMKLQCVEIELGQLGQQELDIQEHKKVNLSIWPTSPA